MRELPGECPLIRTRADTNWRVRHGGSTLVTDNGDSARCAVAKDRAGRGRTQRGGSVHVSQRLLHLHVTFDVGNVVSLHCWRQWPTPSLADPPRKTRRPRYRDAGHFPPPSRLADAACASSASALGGPVRKLCPCPPPKRFTSPRFAPHTYPVYPCSAASSTPPRGTCTVHSQTTRPCHDGGQTASGPP